MTRHLVAVLSLATLLSFVSSCAFDVSAQANNYGSNPEAGKAFVHDGIELYYEIYGVGEPLLLVHGNAASIASLASQIDHFRDQYQVIVMDSRDHGRSADSLGSLTYEKMTSDLAALLDHLEVGPARVFGWSDGGVEALLLAIHYPTKVSKIAAFAANLNPAGLHPDTLDLLKSSVESTPKTQLREIKVGSIMLDQPNVDVKALEGISAPTLILAGDHDLVKDEHTLEIFHSIPNSQLAIVPDSTHMLPFDDPELFNSIVERFFRTPFQNRDRIGDFMMSMEKMLQSD